MTRVRRRRLRRVVLVGGGLALLVAAAAGLKWRAAMPERRSRHLAAVAEIALADGRAEDAERLAGEALGYDPSLEAALWTRAAALGRLGRVDEAVPLLDRAAALAPSHATPALLRAEIEVRRGAPEAALAALRAATAAGCEDVLVRRALGRAAAHAGRLGEAAEVLRAPETLRDAPLQDAAFAADVLAFVGRHAWDDAAATRAAQLRREIAAADPQMPAAALVVAGARLAVGDVDAAIRAAEAAGADGDAIRYAAMTRRVAPRDVEDVLAVAARAPTRPDVAGVLAEELVAAGLTGEGEDLLRRALAAFRDDRALAASAVRVGRARHLAAHPEELLARVLVRPGGGWAPLDDALLAAAARADDPVAGVVRVRDALEALLHRPPAERDAQAVERVLADAQALAAARPADAVPWVLVGAARLASGRASAEEVLLRAASLDPALPEAQAVLGLARLARGDADGAHDAGAAALRLAPAREGFAAIRLRALLAAGRADAAVQAARAARTASPTDLSATAALLDALAATGRRAPADEDEAAALRAGLAAARGDVDEVLAWLRSRDGLPSAATDAVVRRAARAALPALAAAAARAPGDTAETRAHVRALLLAGRADAAADAMRAASLRIERARLLADLGRAADARSELEALAAEAPTPGDVHLDLAVVQAQAGRADDAAATLRGIVAGDAAPGLRARAAARLLALPAVSGDDRAAVRAAIAGDAFGADAPRVEAWLALADGDPARAAQRAAALPAADDPDDDALRLAIAAASGDAAGALGAAETALRRAPSSQHARRRVAGLRLREGVVAWGGGRADEALDHWRAALLGTDVDACAGALIGWATLAASGGDRAVAAADEMETAAPGGAGAPAARAVVLRALGRRDAAAAAFREAASRAHGAPWPSLALAALGATPPDPAADAPPALAPLLRALRHDADGERAEAADAYRAAFDAAPVGRAVVERWVRALAAAGRPDDARAAVDRFVADARAADPRLPPPWVDAFVGASGMEDALRALVPPTGAAAGRLAEATLRRAAGDAEGAARALEAAADLAPDDFDVQARLVRHHASRRLDLALVRPRYERPQDDPRAAAVSSTLLGMLAEDARDPEAAERHYRAALAADGRLVPALNNLAWLLAVGRRRVADAVPVARLALAAAPGHPEVLDTAAWVLHLAKEDGEALRLATRAVSAEPGRADFVARRGEVLLALRAFDEAEAALARAEALDPGVPEVARLRAGLRAARRGGR